MGEILLSLRAHPISIATSTYIKTKEALYILDEVDEDRQKKRIPIDLEPFVESDLLRIVQEDFDALADDMIVLGANGVNDTGEQICGAIARQQNWAIALDDRKARAKLAQLFPNNQLLTTLDLLKYWADTSEIDGDILRTVFENIKKGGRYVPHKENQHYLWAAPYLPDF